jgi:hypothetical protein
MEHITLNKADVKRILEVLETHNIDYFKLIKEDSSGIGYTLDIEYYNGTKCKIPVVGVDEW